MPQIFDLQHVLPAANITNVQYAPANAPDTPDELMSAAPTQAWNPQEFAHELLIMEAYRTKLFDRIKGQIVVDLGAGPYPTMYLLCCAAQAKAYVGIEKYHSALLRINIQHCGQFRKDVEYYVHTTIPEGHSVHPLNYVPAVLISDDAKNALQRMPNNSVTITACGLDGGILSPGYARQLELVISRKMHPQGAFVGYCSRLFVEGTKYTNLFHYKVNSFYMIASKLKEV